MDQAAKWFSAHGYNMAVLLPANLWCLDFDSDEVFSSWEAATAPDLLDTYAESSPRGFHYFYRMALPSELRLVKGVEVKKHCLVSPSDVGGFRYTPVNGQAEIRAVDDYKALILSLLSDSPVLTGYRPVGSERVYQPPPGGDLISRIKAARSVWSLASSLTELKPSPPGQARWFAGRCPIHDDQTPSFWVDTEKDIWGCFSPSCVGHLGGDVVNLWALSKGLTNQEAIKALAGGLG